MARRLHANDGRPQRSGRTVRERMRCRWRRCWCANHRPGRWRLWGDARRGRPPMGGGMASVAGKTGWTVGGDPPCAAARRALPTHAQRGRQARRRRRSPAACSATEGRGADAGARVAPSRPGARFRRAPAGARRCEPLVLGSFLRQQYPTLTGKFHLMYALVDGNGHTVPDDARHARHTGARVSGWCGAWLEKSSTRRGRKWPGRRVLTCVSPRLSLCKQVETCQ